jgi:hypothetical protein
MRLLDVNATLSRETSVSPNCLALSANINFRPNPQYVSESVRQLIHEPRVEIFLYSSGSSWSLVSVEDTNRHE